MSAEQFDPEKVERIHGVSGTDDGQCEEWMLVAASDYDALLALYRDAVKQRKFMAGCV